MDKERWKKPLLTVLVKSKPEESVLDNCKSAVDPTSTTANSYQGCDNPGCPSGCETFVES